MGRFRDWIVEAGIIPAPIAGAWGQKWQQALGVIADAIAEGARQAARARWIATCPDDALALHGKSLGWEQAPGETTEEYRARLLQSWHLAEWAGTAKGITDAFAAIGMGVDVVDTFNSAYVRADAGVPERYHWFWVIVRTHPFGTDFAFRWGDGTTWGAKTYGVNGDPRLIELMRRIVRKMKPATGFCEWIIVVLAGDVIAGVGSGDGEDLFPDGASSRVAYIVP